MAEHPKDVGVIHHVATGIIGEEVEVGIAIKRQHRTRHGECGHRIDQHDRDAQAGPAEQRHAHEMHARRAALEDGYGEIHAGQCRSHARDQDRPEPVVDALTGAEIDAGIGRIHRPAARAELADQQRDHDQCRPGSGQPEAHLIENGKGHVARAQLLRQHEIDEADQQWHGDEENHDRAVRAEELRKMVGSDEAAFLFGQSAERRCLVRTHHKAFNDATCHHDQRKCDIHDADLFGVGRRQPIAVKRAPPAHPGQQQHSGERAQHQHAGSTRTHDCAAVHISQKIGVGRYAPAEIAEDRACLLAHLSAPAVSACGKPVPPQRPSEDAPPGP